MLQVRTWEHVTNEPLKCKTSEYVSLIACSNCGRFNCISLDISNEGIYEYQVDTCNSSTKKVQIVQ